MSDTLHIPVRTLDDGVEMDLQLETAFGTMRTSEGNLPLKALSVHSRIADVTAHTTVRQTFKNVLQQALEATYIFPLPPRAAVTSFTMQVGERLVKGVLEERQKAREEYERAIRQGYRAAITEEDRQNVFNLRVGNLMPGEEAEVTFTMVCPLDVDVNEVTYRFPLVVAPRYIPGVPLDDESVGDGTVPDTDRVPDASRITPPVLLPGFPNPVRLSIAVDVETSGLPVENLRCSLPVQATQQADGTVTVTLQPGQRLNRDFILRYSLASQTLTAGALVSPDVPDALEGTFQCLITAPDVDQSSRPSRDVVFVLDRSGSMSGWKMEAARRVTARLLDSLSGVDQFGLLVFANTIEAYRDANQSGLVPATDRNRYRALEWLAHVHARGGTEVLPALQQAVSMLQRAPAQASRNIVLVTDGQVGNEDEVVRTMRKAGISLFVVGVDTAVNDALLRRLAEGTGGTCELVESQERLDEVLARLVERLGVVALSQVRVDIQSPAGANVQLVRDDLVPAGMVNLPPRSSLLLRGRYTGSADNWSLVVSGYQPDGTPWQAVLTPRVTQNPAVRAEWARALIRQLEDEYVTNPSAQLEQRILNLSLENSVLCRFTAYVAVDHSEAVNAGGRVQRIVQPVDAPAEWEMYDVGYDAVVGVVEPDGLRHMVRGFAQSDVLMSRMLAVPPEMPTAKPSVDRLLRAVWHLNPNDRDRVEQVLRELVVALDAWISELKANWSAQEMVKRLQELKQAIQSAHLLAMDAVAIIELIQRCYQTLQELDRSGLLSPRRSRWW